MALQEILPNNVPNFCPLDNQSLQKHLDLHSNGKWRELLSAFKTAQKQEKARIKDEAVLILKELRNEIIQIFTNHPLNDQRLHQFLKTLQDQSMMLMVRSTGREDTIDLANPGGNESIASVSPNIEAVSIAMGRVIASYFSEKSLQQRLLSQDDISDDDVFIPVLIQEMIGEPIKGNDLPNTIVRSGVMYTGQAFTRIQVAPGHGEFVVNSKGLFDTYTVTRENMVYPEIRVKKYRLVPSADGLELKENPKSLQHDLSLPTDVVKQLTEIGRQIEDYYEMPMDVEFTYEPQNNKLSIVQARPIPAGKVNSVVPSTVPSDGISILKEHISNGDIRRQAAQVITAAGFAAQLITNPNEILVCSHLSDALAQYLNQANSPVKAVVVEHLAPNNSHEAAQFNLMGIPVLQVNDIATISQWSQVENPVLMIDPQRAQILNFNTFVPHELVADEFLREQGLIADGLFTHPVVATTSIPLSMNATRSQSNRLVDQLESQPEALQRMFEKLPQGRPDGIDIEHMYTQLLSNIEILENAIDAKQSALPLDQVKYVLLQFAKHNPSQATFLPQSMVLCEEIERSIQRIEKIPALNKEDMRALRSEHLELIARLKSLISFPGALNTFSNSLRQVIQEEAIKKSVDTNYYKNLDKNQADYLTQFLKLNKIAFNETTQKRWTDFVSSCIAHQDAIPILAFVINFYTANQLESDLINQDLASLSAKHTAPIVILNKLYQTCVKAKDEFSTLHLNEMKHTIEAWADRVHEWENTDAFDRLWLQYQQDVLPLVDKLQTKNDDNYSQTTQKAILSIALSLIDMMDATIKSLKRCPTKTLVKQTEMVDRFALLLKPYYELMSNWVNAVPNESIAAVFSNTGILAEGGYKNPIEYKEIMLSKMKTILNTNNRSPTQLVSSGDFNVSSAKIGSSANFQRQFIEKMQSITLEDIFSLIHQNTLASISMIQQYHYPKAINSLPVEMQGVLIKAQQSKLDLLSINHHYPIVTFNFNLPMRNHSATFNFEYN